MSNTMGIKLAAENEKQFKAALTDIDRSFKVLGSEMKVVASQFDKNDNSVEALTARNNVLNKQIDAQREKIAFLKDTLEQASDVFGKNDKRTQEWQIKLNNAQAALNKMERELQNNTAELDRANKQFDDAEKTLDVVEKEMDNVADSADDMGERIEAAGRDAERSEGRFSKLGDVLKTVGVAMGAVVTAAGAAAIKLGKEVVSAYADYEQLVGGVETLFETSADKVEQYAREAYQTAGLSANQYLETVTGFSASLIQALGGDTEKAAKKADMAITDMSDNANKMGSDMQTIRNAYAGFSKGQFQLLDNLKLGYGGTKTEMERLLMDAQAISGIEYNIDSYADIVDAIHLIQTQMGITGTTAKEAQSTISGSISMTKSALENLVAGFGDADADIKALCTDVVTSFASVVTNVKPILESLVAALPAAIDAMLDAAAALLPTLLEAFADLFSEILATVLRVLPQLFPEVIKALGTIANTIIENIPTIVSSVIRMLSMVLNAVATALPKLIPMIVSALLDAVQAIIDNIGAFIDAGVKVILALADGIVAAIPKIIEKIPVIVKSVTEALKGALPTLIEGVKQLVASLAQALPEIIKVIVKILPEVLRMIADALPRLLEDILDAVSELFPMILDAVVKLIAALAEALPEIIKSVVDVLPKLIGKIVQAVVRLIPVLIEALVACLPQLIDGLIQLILGIVGALPDIIKGLIEALPTIITAIITGLMQALPQLILGLIELVMELVLHLPEIILALVEAIPTVIETLVDTLLDGDNLEKLIQGCVEMNVKLAEEMPRIITKLVEEVPKIVDKIVSKFKSLIGRFTKMGGEMLSGLWQGISDKAQWLRDQISGFFGGIVDNIKNFFGIHSPSTLFRDQIGRNMALGIGEGFSAEMERVARDMQNAVPVNFDTNVQASAYSAGEGAARSIVTNISFGDVTLASDMDINDVAQRVSDAIVLDILRKEKAYA